MPRDSHSRPNSISSSNSTSQKPPSFDSVSGTLKQDQIQRWAELIADGRGEFPTELPPTDQNRLAAEVRTLLRNRLVRLIARAVATQIHSEAGNKTEGT
jgi:hypothetical protein